MPQRGETRIRRGRTQYYVESRTSPGTFYWSNNPPTSTPSPSGGGTQGGGQPSGQQNLTTQQYTQARLEFERTHPGQTLSFTQWQQQRGQGASRGASQTQTTPPPTGGGSQTGGQPSVAPGSSTPQNAGGGGTSATPQTDISSYLQTLPQDQRGLVEALYNYSNPNFSEWVPENQLRDMAYVRQNTEERLTNFLREAQQKGIELPDDLKVRLVAQYHRINATSRIFQFPDLESAISSLPYPTYNQITGNNYQQWQQDRASTSSSQGGGQTPNVGGQQPPAQPGQPGATQSGQPDLNNQAARRLALRAIQTGATDLQSQAWWIGQDMATRQAAWEMIQGFQGGTLTLDQLSGQTTTPTTLGTPGTPSDGSGEDSGRSYEEEVQYQNDLSTWLRQNGLTYSPENARRYEASLRGSEGTEGGQDEGARQKALEDALALIDADPNIPPDLKEVFKGTIRNWDPSKEINVQNVLNEFNRIKNETIDPQFRERVTQYINDFQTQAGEMQAQTERELEAERFTSGENIRQAQAGLETSGLTFSGKGIEQLGAQSAFAQPGTPQAGTSATPLQEPFGGLFFEGTVNQANRLMSSSSEARRRQQQNLLRRGAEGALGSAGLGGLGFQGFGDVSQGTIEQQRQQALAGTLQQLLGQGRQQTAAQQPLNYSQ